MMAEKKKGFFQRLFGGGESPARESDTAPETVPEDEPTVAEELEADILLDELVEAAPLVLPPDQEIALAEALHETAEAISPSPPAAEPPPGPPETTPGYVEQVEEDEALEPEQVEPTPTAMTAPEPAAPAKQSWFQRLASGLKRSSDQLTGGIASVFTKKKLDEAMLEELEDLLIQSDFGLEMAADVTGALRRDRFDRDITTEEVREVLAAEVQKVLEPVARPLVVDPAIKPFVILTVGVNGSGKTTTIGKLSSLLRAQGKKVMLAAGDTFRAAAIEQLQVWGERTGAPVIARPAGSDASGLVFEAVSRANVEGADGLMIDTS
jgi:fused signal recognition particle receptor